MTTVETGARLHFGFGNLSLAHERLYGSLGLALAEPTVTVAAERDDGITCDDPEAAPYLERVVGLLDVPGASVSVDSDLPRHAGLGSGTALSLSLLSAVARAYDQAPAVRERAPDLGRGGRSGVGVAAVERGGFVLDAGHPTALFTTSPPDTGEWSVPEVAARHPIPEDWRFLLVLPEAGPGRSGEAEDAAMRRAVEDADPGLADQVAGLVTRRVLPAIAEGSVERFGSAVAELGRLNGSWYADEQGGVYRPPVGGLVESLSASSAVDGAGQSSWGPAVYGVTDVSRADAAREAGRAALDAAGVDGSVRVVRGRNRGARVLE